MAELKEIRGCYWMRLSDHVEMVADAERRGAFAWRPVITPPDRDPSFPSHSVDVLMWDGKEVQFGFLIFGDDEHDIEPSWSTPTGWTVDNVTHWMPLPSGPEVRQPGEEDQEINSTAGPGPGVCL